MSETIAQKPFTQAADPEVLLRYLHTHYPGAEYCCAYEAGFSGFEAARFLQDHGARCLVVHPGAIARTAQEKVRKNDRSDARRLARELRAGNLRSVYIPSACAVEARMLVRTRAAYARKQTRCKNQIKMALHNLSIALPPSFDTPYWSNARLEWLAALELETPAGTAAIAALLNELRFLRTQILTVTREIRVVARQAAYAKNVALLCGIPGIGVLTAMTVLTELIEMSRFGNADALASYFGLVPGEHSSGEKVQQSGLTHQCNGSIRHVIIESAWVAVRVDPALMRVFVKASARMPRNKAIVVVAHRLLNRIRAVLLSGQEYQMGMTRVQWRARRNRGHSHHSASTQAAV